MSSNTSPGPGLGPSNHETSKDASQLFSEALAQATSKLLKTIENESTNILLHNKQVISNEMRQELDAQRR